MRSIFMGCVLASLLGGNLAMSPVAQAGADVMEVVDDYSLSDQQKAVLVLCSNNYANNLQQNNEGQYNSVQALIGQVRKIELPVLNKIANALIGSFAVGAPVTPTNIIDTVKKGAYASQADWERCALSAVAPVLATLWEQNHVGQDNQYFVREMFIAIRVYKDKEFHSLISGAGSNDGDGIQNFLKELVIERLHLSSIFNNSPLYNYIKTDTVVTDDHDGFIPYVNRNCIKLNHRYTIHNNNYIAPIFSVSFLDLAVLHGSIQVLNYIVYHKGYGSVNVDLLPYCTDPEIIQKLEDNHVGPYGANAYSEGFAVKAARTGYTNIVDYYFNNKDVVDYNNNNIDQLDFYLRNGFITLAAEYMG